MAVSEQTIWNGGGEMVVFGWLFKFSSKLDRLERRCSLLASKDFRAAEVGLKGCL
jgi:hypothetical protein